MKLQITTSAFVTAMVAGGWWLLDHAGSEMVPELHSSTLVSASLAGVALVGVGLGYQGWHWLRRRIPGPWFPYPIWRVRRWLRFRPTFAIISAAPKANIDAAAIHSLGWTLTLAGNALSTPVDLVVDFSRAVLVLRQTRKRRSLRYTFPAVAHEGGESKATLSARTQAFTIVEFAASQRQIPTRSGLDLYGSYSLELSGVRVRALSGAKIDGVLPTLHWQWAPQPAPPLINYDPLEFGV